MFELKQVSQLATVLMGQSPPSSSCIEDGQGLPFIQGNAEFGSRNPIPLLRCSTPTRIAEKGDFLLSVRAPVGELNQSVQRMVIGRGLSAIRFPEIDQPFAWHSLKSAVGGLNRVAQGSTFVAVSRQDVENLDIPWFAVPEYRNNIAYVLDIIDEAIAKTEAVIAKLKHVRTGMLHDLLSYGLDENGQLRDPIAHPEQFKDSQLGRIPMDWSCGVFSEIASVNPPSAPTALRLSTFVSFIPMQDVDEEGRWIHQQARRLIDCGGGYTPFLEGDILFAKITPCMENGKGCHARNLHNGFGFGSTEFHVLRAKTDSSARFIFHWTMNERLRRRALAYMTGSAGQQRVEAGFFNNFIIPIPPSREEQESIAKIIDEADAQVDASKKEVAKLRNLKSGLMSDLLTGQVRVPETIAGGAEGL